MPGKKTSTALPVKKEEPVKSTDIVYPKPSPNKINEITKAKP